MPPLDQRYIEKLDDFTRSLEGIVELLKQDAAKKNVDNVNKLLSNMNDDLKSVVKNMEVVMKSTKKIESQNDLILKEVQEARKAKETGMFGNIADVDNKRKILDAVKVITLIAAGVLAIGIAFKLIAPVNFLSVIAIGLAIVFITGAFIAVSAATEGMTPGDVVTTNGIMILMAVGLMVSSWALALSAQLTFAKAMSILFIAGALGASLVIMVNAVQKAKLEPKDYFKLGLLPIVLPLIAIGLAISSYFLSNIVPMTFMQMATTVFVAAAIGTSLYLITQALDKAKMEGKHVAQILLLPIIVPALAMGLVISSWILKGVMPLSFGQMVSAIFTAVTLGVLVYLMKPLIDKMKEFTFKEVVTAMGLVIALSAGLVAASWILSYMKLMGFKEVMLLIVNSFAIGLSVLFLAPAVYLLKSISREDMIKAAINIVIAAGAIMVSSWLLSLGTYDNVPDWHWAFGAGLTILGVAGTIWLIQEKMNMDYKQWLIGAAIVIGISAVVMATSWILSFGNYDEYPTFGWAVGVGMSLVVFGGAMYLIGKYLDDPKKMLIGAAVVLGVAAVIAAVSWILAIGNYDEYPDYDWATGVGLSLLAFGGSMLALGLLINLTGGAGIGLISIGTIATLLIAGTIVGASYILGLGDYGIYPDVDWAAGVGLSMLTFGASMILLALLGPALLFGSIGMLLAASTITAVSLILSMGSYDKGPTAEWALGVGSLLMAVAASSVIYAAMLPFILLGGFAMKTIAQTIVDVSAILASGNYTGGPTEDWAKGVGLSIKAFAEGISLLSSGGGLFGFLFGTDKTDMIRLIAQAMVDASLILRGGQWTSYPPAEWSKGVGDSILAFAKGMAALEEADVEPGIEFIAVVTMLSWGIIAAARILNSFDWKSVKNYPTEEWSRGVGAAINAFAEPLSNLAKYDVTGGDITSGVKRLAKALVTAAEIIGDYDWKKATNYPSVEWSNNVGKAIGVFVQYLIDIENNDLGTRDLRVLRKTISAMIDAAKDISKVDPKIWKTYPPVEWADAVGNAIGKFVKYLIDIENNDISKGEIRNLNRIIDQMVDAAKSFAKVDVEVWKKAPPIEWSQSIEKSIESFVNSIRLLSSIDEDDFDLINKAGFSMVRFVHKMIMLERHRDMFMKGGLFDTFSESMKKLTTSLPTPESVEGLDALGQSLSNITSMGLTTSFSIYMLSKSMSELGETLKKIDMTSLDKLSKFSNGMLVLSLIDEKKFNDAISIIDKKKNDIIAILSDNETIKSRPSMMGSTTLEESTAAEAETTTREQFYQELLYRVTSLDTNVGEMLKIQKEQPSPNESDEEETSSPAGGVGSQQTNPSSKGY